MSDVVGIRWLIRRDIPEVVDIEQKSFEFAWTEDNLVNVLRQRNCIGMVATKNDQVIGYMIYLLDNKTIKLINLCVHPDYLRQGIGTQMIDHLKSKLIAQRRHDIILEVRETNLPAQLFFKSVYFLATGVNPEPYDYCNESSYTMRYCLPLDDMLPTG